ALITFSGCLVCAGRSPRMRIASAMIATWTAPLTTHAGTCFLMSRSCEVSSAASVRRITAAPAPPGLPFAPAGAFLSLTDLSSGSAAPLEGQREVVTKNRLNRSRNRLAVLVSRLPRVPSGQRFGRTVGRVERVAVADRVHRLFRL